MKESEFSTVALSRRSVIQGAAIASAVVAGTPPTFAQSVSTSSIPQDVEAMIDGLHDAVYINSNENPLGPCPTAVQALGKLAGPLSGRYGMALASRLEALFARQNGLRTEEVKLLPGSFLALRAVALSYSSRERPVAYFEPTFDNAFFGNPGQPLTNVVAAPLSGDYAIDVKKLLTLAPNAGIYYLCNPNNPTGLVTPRTDIEWLLANKPAGSIVLVDEAYIHFSDAESCLGLIHQNPDLMVTQTFSKAYGLAGLRCGLLAASKERMDGLSNFGMQVNPLPAVIAAEASLLDTKLIPQRKAYNKAVRDDLYAWLSARGIQYLPSQASFVMIHVGRPGADVTAALAKEKIFIGGPRKHLEDWVRVSFGTPEEMQKFKTALLKVLA